MEDNLTNMNDPTSEEIRAIDLLKRDDISGMETLVRIYQTRAVYCAYLIVQDNHLAQDIVQNAFITAYQKIARFDQSKPFGPWFFRSVVNASIKTSERENKHTVFSNQDEVGFDWAERLLDTGPSLQEVVETQETREIVWKALSQLSPRQRGVVVMHYFLEMKDEEIMQATNSPKTSIRWWLRTARERLQHLLLPFIQTEQDIEFRKERDGFHE
jgi:RNA polymerase sigma-70 factor, ECF subfamily